MAAHPTSLELQARVGPARTRQGRWTLDPIDGKGQAQTGLVRPQEGQRLECPIDQGRVESIGITCTPDIGHP